jgi:predicted metal-dependent hydrolase
MEKEFEKFCSRVKREREGLYSRTKVAAWIKEEGLHWLEHYSSCEVARRIGFSESFVRRWKRGAGVVARKSVRTSAVQALPAVINVTKISAPKAHVAGQVLARLVRGDVVVEFLDMDALVRAFPQVLS